MTTAFRTTVSILLLPSLASAQLLVPLDQDRFVSALAEADDLATFLSDSESSQAPDFGPFADTASAAVFDPGAESSTGGAQDSAIVGNSIVGTGSASGSAFYNEGLWLASGFGASVVSIDFQVSAKARYRLEGMVTAFDNGVATTTLHVLDGPLIFGRTSLGEGEMPVDTSGVLEPGSYRLLYRATAGVTTKGAVPFDFAFSEYDLSFELTPLATNFCLTAPNSAGVGALLSAAGSFDVAANDFRVQAFGVPANVFGLLFYGPSQVQVAFGDGFRCVGGMTHRLQPVVQADGAGMLSKSVDFTTGAPSSGSGEILPESTWNFQLWYRDPMGPGGTGFNTSDGLSVTFCE